MARKLPGTAYCTMEFTPLPEITILLFHTALGKQEMVFGDVSWLQQLDSSLMWISWWDIHSQWILPSGGRQGKWESQGDGTVIPRFLGPHTEVVSSREMGLYHIRNCLLCPRHSEIKCYPKLRSPRGDERLADIFLRTRLQFFSDILRESIT